MDEIVLTGFPNQKKLMNGIATYMAPLLNNAERKKFAEASMRRTLTRHLDSPESPLTPVENTVDEENQYAVLYAFLALCSIRQSFSQCEFYFRRFPFSNLPVSHADHLRNVCEMYFDRIEQFRDRLKKLVNNIKECTREDDDRFGEIIKNYNKYFCWENKQRNLTHHYRRFEYDAIDQMGLMQLLGHANEFTDQNVLSEIMPEIVTIYRKEARRWVERVRRHGEVLEAVVEFSAGLVLEKCSFLNPVDCGGTEPPLKHQSSPDQAPPPGPE